MLAVQGRITAIFESIEYTCTRLSKILASMSTLDTREYSEYSSIQYSMSASIDLGKCNHTHEYILVIYLGSQGRKTAKKREQFFFLVIVPIRNAGRNGMRCSHSHFPRKGTPIPGNTPEHDRT
jgi:hypothetical protein